MKRWLKIVLISIVIIAVGLVGAFLYVDYKVTQAMVNMAKKQDEMTKKDETPKEIDLPHESIPTGSIETVANPPQEQEVNTEKAPNMVNEEMNDKDIMVNTSEQTDQADTNSSSNSESMNESVSVEAKEVVAQKQTVTPDEVEVKVKEEEDVTEVDSDDLSVDSDISQAGSAQSSNTDVEEDKPSAEEVSEDVSFAEKAKAYDLAMSKLTGDQVNRLYEMASGGFTQEEKEEAKSMFYANFTAEEQKWIMEMYRKYY